MKHTITDRDAQHLNLFGLDKNLGMNNDLRYADPIFGADEMTAEFYLADDFGEKLDLTKESSIFVNRILTRLIL